MATLIQGTDNQDYLYGTAGDDQIFGYAGNDALVVWNGNDVLDGGIGNDTLNGNYGNDIYLFYTGSGQDSIYDAGGNDTISFGVGVLPEYITFTRVGLNLVIGNNQTSDRITVFDWGTSTSSRIESIEFTLADNTKIIWDAAQIQSLIPIEPLSGGAATYAWTGFDDILIGDDTSGSVLVGNTGNDTLISGKAGWRLIGGSGNDTLIGNISYDLMEGGPGDDLYVIAQGGGKDEISVGGGLDTLQFGEGINPDSIIFTRSGPNLVLTFDGSSDQVTVLNYDYFTRQLEQIKFSDANNTIWDRQEVLSRIQVATVVGSEGSDTLYAWSGIDDKLMGMGGSDALYGRSGSNIIDGGAGNDLLKGDAGEDVLYGGVGDDELFGDDGDDLLYGGDGKDSLDGGNGNDLLEGGDGDDRLWGWTGEDILAGGHGNDVLSGNAGNDVYLFGLGDGQDVISEDSGFDILRFGVGIRPEDVIVSRINTQTYEGDLLFSISGTSDQIVNFRWGNPYTTAYRIEQVEFSDPQYANVVWDAATIKAIANNRPPVLQTSIADQTTLEDEPFIFQVPAGSITDPDAGSVLSYSAKLEDGSPLPAWLTFDAATRTFSGVPENEDVGAFSVTVTAMDQWYGRVSDTFNLSVVNVNDAPSGAATGILADGIEDVSYTVSVTELLQGFTDIDGDALMASGLSSDHGVVADHGDGTYTLTPEADYNGQVTFSYDVVDGNGGSLAASLGFALVAVNDAPVVASALTDQNAVETQALSLTWNYTPFFDVDGDVLAYSAAMSDGTILPAWLIFDPATMTFGGTPDLNAAGQYSISVTATDPDGLLASDTFVLDVANLVVFGNANSSWMNGTAGNDYLSGTDAKGTLDGLEGDDIILGNGGDDKLNGGDGSDVLYGGDGDDTLKGGDGVDMLYGEAGSDTFIFDWPASADIVYDFESGSDRILIDHSAYGGQNLGQLNHNIEMYVEYVQENEATGHLYFDADSTGPGEGVEVVTILGGSVDVLNDVTII